MGVGRPHGRPRSGRRGAGARPAQAQGASCPTGGLSLSPGFCATIFADNLGNVRHMARGAGRDGLRQHLERLVLFPARPAPAGGFLVAMQDTDGDGKADKVTHFGLTPADGVQRAAPASALYKGYVYAEMNDKIVRYPLAAGRRRPGRQAARWCVRACRWAATTRCIPSSIDAKGQIFVDMGTATNSCQPTGTASPASRALSPARA